MIGGAQAWRRLVRAVDGVIPDMLLCKSQTAGS